MPSLTFPEETKAYIDMKMGVISVKKYRQIIGLE